MSNYYNTGVTVELGELIDSGFKLFDFDYPSYYQGDQKTAFEQKVIDRYRFRQIGQETPGRFKHVFRTRVREIMPYYIQLYKFQESVDKIEDPLESYNLTETYEQNRTGNSTGSATSEADRESAQTGSRRFSNTPQGSLDNLDDHLTEATLEEATESENTATTSQSTTQDNENNRYTLTRRGNIGVQPLGGEIRDIRASFINIDEMVLDALNDLFLKLY